MAPTLEDLEERSNWRVKSRLDRRRLGGVVRDLGRRHGAVAGASGVPAAAGGDHAAIPFLIVAASATNPVLFFCVALPRMTIPDPIHITLGRRYGGRFVPAAGTAADASIRPRGSSAPTDEQGAGCSRCLQVGHGAGVVADVLGTVGLVASVFVTTTTLGWSLPTWLVPR